LKIGVIESTLIAFFDCLVSQKIPTGTCDGGKRRIGIGWVSSHGSISYPESIAFQGGGYIGATGEIRGPGRGNYSRSQLVSDCQVMRLVCIQDMWGIHIYPSRRATPIGNIKSGDGDLCVVLK